MVLLNVLLKLSIIYLSSVHLTVSCRYKVYEVTPKSYEDAEFLQKFSDDKFDFWKESRTLGDPSDIMVAPEDQSYFEREFTKHGLKYKVAVDDVER